MNVSYSRISQVGPPFATGAPGLSVAGVTASIFKYAQLDWGADVADADSPGKTLVVSVTMSNHQ